ncbi:MAG: hypothetical protein R3C11_20855 [Planctomycetaceae bacterium]
MTMFRTLLLVLGLFSLAGCGQATYDARLNETAAYYAYINETESVLDSEWKSRGEITGIKLRPPKGFKQISAPKTETDDEGNVISEAVDERQPRNIPGFYDGELPGIVGAWYKNYDVQTDTGNMKFTVRMYLLAQNNFINDEDSTLPFRDLVYDQIYNDLNVQTDNQWLEETYPSRDLYTRKIQYKEMRFEPGIAMNGFSPSGIEIQLDAHDEDGKSVVLLFVKPNGLSSKDRDELKSGISKSLQTLEVRKSESSTDQQEPAEEKSDEEKSEEKPKSEAKPKQKKKAPAF